LGLRPRRAVLNDVNAHLINFYSHLKRGLLITLAMANDERQYYQHRTRFNALLADGQQNTKAAAELFYYLNRTGYNGLCRFNSKGEFNVPFGRYKTIGYVRDFSRYREIVRGWRFTQLDVACLPLNENDFVYADPPYDVEFTDYSQGGFTWEDQVRTAELLARHPGPLVLVNQATPRILRLYRDLGYTIRTVDAPRRISCTGDRTPAQEVIAVRNRREP
jgi:DNA adenine methylase